MSNSKPLDLWTWANIVYARPDVAKTCIDLQDNHDQCVSYLLWAIWACVNNYDLDENCISDACDIAHAYHHEVIAPLRRLRLKMKSPISDIEDMVRIHLREKVKVLELDTEKQLILALESLIKKEKHSTKQLVASYGHVEVLNNLVLCAKAWGTKIPRAQLTILSKLILGQ